MMKASRTLRAKTDDAAVAAAKPPPGPVGEREGSLQPLVVALATVAALYFGRDIFIPLALALLTTFALSPVVSILRRGGVPRIAAVLAVVSATLMGIVLFAAVVGMQLAVLAENLPSYQANITTKMRTIREASVGEGVISRARTLLEHLGREMEESEEEESPAEEPAIPGIVDPTTEEEPEREPQVDPIPVQISEPEMAPLELLRTIVTPLVEPVATGGIVIVVVIFMLFRREDLRDRLIRLMGPHDINRTTAALGDAGKRVGQYLLMQIVVNGTYAIPITLGLWLIGVPNALLWGMMAFVLRFIPYIGPIIAALLPLALSIAVDPGWTMFVWTAALFVVLELASNNFVEPWLYGSRTGLSPVAIILAAIFWTWLWGPIGLLVSTPLTVCLVVLGRHVPQFQFLDVLLGNEPVLSPHEQLYQRLLANDPDEATERAEEFLRENMLADFYEKVALPALVMAEEDRSRGVLDEFKRERVADGMLTLIDNLEEHEDPEPEPEEGEAEDKPDEEQAADGRAEDVADDTIVARPTMPNVLCAGGRGNLDDAAASMLADVLERAGSDVSLVEHEDLESGRTSRVDLEGKDLIVVGYLNPDSATHARYVVRRLRRLRRDADIVIAFWGEELEEAAAEKLAERIRCDHAVTSLRQVIEIARDLAGEDQVEQVAEKSAKPKKSKPKAKAEQTA